MKTTIRAIRLLSQIDPLELPALLNVRLKLGRDDDSVVPPDKLLEIALYDWLGQTHPDMAILGMGALLDELRPYFTENADWNTDRSATADDVLEIVDGRYARGLCLGDRIYDITDARFTDKIDTACVTIVGCHVLNLMRRWRFLQEHLNVNNGKHRDQGSGRPASIS